MAAKGNRIKNQDGEKPARSSKKLSFKEKIQSVITFFKSERTHRIFGLSVLLLSVFLLIAFTSYIFTWQADHDKVTGTWWSLLGNKDIRVENWLGKFGALISHQFMVNWFGISSFIFVGILFLLGFKILFNISLLPFKKTFAYSFFALVFISTAMGFIFQSGKSLFL
ncbi:MAG TPA: DNA translocase FtsK 4TM domain-containing protein, partial [Bacteroidia bacterium]|nr:DNA translocase FtsK 4TM domain-containing protein [Bacteroidia bacterium]